MTCFIDIPFSKSSEPNVKLSFRAQTFAICKDKVTHLVGQDSTVKFFAWVPIFKPDTHHGMGKLKMESNCYAFRRCNKRDQVSLSSPGTTYELNESK